MRPNDLTGLSAAALALGLTSAAGAAPAIGPCAGVYASIAGLSDYRFDGFSDSNHQPTWQVTAYCYRNDGVFVGATFTGVDFEDTPRTHFEADWYAGRQVQLGAYKVTAELLYTSFPDKRAPGPSYDIFEPQLEVARSLNGLTLGATTSWETSMSGGGREWRVRANVAYAAASWLTLSGHAGRFFATSGADRPHDTWDVGATATWRRFSLDARYGGTNQPPSQCFFTNWCKPGPYVSLTYKLYP